MDDSNSFKKVYSLLEEAMNLLANIQKKQELKPQNAIKIQAIWRGVHARMVFSKVLFKLQKNVLVLWHTPGNYPNDWEPNTPYRGETTRIKWNGQNYQRDDHLLLEHNTRCNEGKKEFGIILSRDKKTGPFRLEAIFSGITQQTFYPKGTANRFIWNKVFYLTNILGYNIGEELTIINGLGPRDSALAHLRLQRISGGNISGIQYCRKI